MTLKELNKKLEKDYEELVERGNKDYKFFLDNAYAYAHYNEILYYFADMEEEDYKERWEELISKCDLSGNILESIYDQWLDYNHPEYYNFFCYEGLVEIIEYFFKTHQMEAR